MRKSFLIIVSLLIFPAFAWAQGTISGTVYSEASGDPIGGAHVMAFPVNSMHPAADAQTGPEGTYTLQVPFGSYQVNSVAQDYYPEWYNNVQHRSEAAILEVAEGQNPSGIDFTLAGFQQNGGAISGRIIEEGTDNGIPMAQVTATRITGDPFERTNMSMWNGIYFIHDLPSGSYVVTATKWGWTDGVYPETLLVDNNALENINIFLSPMNQETGSIAGVITDAGTGEPIEGAFVFARGNNHFNSRMAFSGPDGAYLINDLHPDIYHVGAHKEGYFPGEYPDPIEVNGNDVTGIDIALSGIIPSGIKGTVTDAGSGAPIAEAMVVAVNVNDHRMHRGTMTGEDGNYVLDVPPGEYVVQARAWGYMPQEYPEHVIVPEGAYIENINFALTAIDFGSISGMVIDTSGNPVPMAEVKARMADGFFCRRAVTDETGAYTITDVIPGSYIVRAFKYGFEPGVYPDTVLVGGGEDVTGIDIVLVPFAPPFDGYISGLVTDETAGTPISGALVIGIGFEEGHRHHVIFRRSFTADDGSYTLPYLPPIPFRIFAVHPDYIGEFYDNVYHYSEATPVIPDAEGINFALVGRNPGIRSISGQIIIQGQELPGEAIIYATVDGQIVDIAASDIDGYYSLNDLEIGAYEISAFTVLGEGELGYPADVTFDDLEGADILLNPTSTDGGSELLPTHNSLSQNYPNPFNARTMIAFDVASTADVQLSVFNILGQRVALLANGVYQPGSYEVVWNGYDLKGQPAATGIYYYRLTVGDYSETMRMTLLK